MKTPAALLLCLLVWFTTFSGYAQSFDAYEKAAFKAKGGHELPYRILYPKGYAEASGKQKQKYPLVVVLHGAGERGSDNEKQLTHGGKLFLQERNRTDFPAVVIFPQCPTDSYWSSVKIDRNKSPLDLQFDYHRPMTWPLKAVRSLVKKLARDKRIDKSRLYITGLSMGGMGTFELIARYPKVFAAAAPVCGGGDTTYCEKFAKRVPVWVFHGDKDNVVAPRHSREMVAKLQSLGADVQYSEYLDVQHNSWDNAFAEPDFMSWLFGHRKKRK